MTKTSKTNSPNTPLHPAIFLDRDGVLNVDTGYAHKAEHLEVFEDVPECLKMWKEQGCLLIVLSNQSGVARGFFSYEQVRDFNALLNQEIIKGNGPAIDAFYICPHHPSGTVPEFTKLCNCRKPQPGLVHQAQADWNIDLRRSVLIGDKASDVETARHFSDLRTILMQRQDQKSYVSAPSTVGATAVARDLRQAVEISQQWIQDQAL